MNFFDLFSSFLNPVLVIDAKGIIQSGNLSLESTTGLKNRQITGSVFPKVLGFELPKDFDIGKVNEATSYKEVDFETNGRKGTFAYSIQSLANVGIGPFWLVNMYDVTLEKSLQDKYKAQRHNSENLISEVLTQKADLLLSRDELDRRVSQMTLLLRFYSETRFVFDPSLLAQTFLKIACENLGFLSGYYFSITPGKSELELQSVIELDVEPEAPGSFKYPYSMAKAAPDLQILSDASIPDEFYKSLGIEIPLNGIVLTLKRESREVGQFYLLNYLHNAQIDQGTIDLLEYMLSPLNLTFENAALYHSSVTDELSGLNNIRYFKMRLESEINRAKREDKTVSLILFDIDHFKKVNDTYGHQMGDQVIQAVAQCIRKNVRSSDIVARYGGEEIVVVLPATALDMAYTVAEKIRSRVEELSFKSAKLDFKVTISGGVSSYPDQSANEERLIAGADEALYRSKSRGRNQISRVTDQKTS